MPPASANCSSMVAMAFRSLNMTQERWMVEGMLCEMVASLKAAVDVLRLSEVESGLTQSENVRSSYAIWREELSIGCELLKEHHDSALNPRHRDVRWMMSDLHQWCVDNDLVANEDESLNYEFVVRAIQFLKDFHRVMSDGPTYRSRGSKDEPGPPVLSQ